MRKILPLVLVTALFSACSGGKEGKTSPPANQVQSYPVFAVTSQATTLDTDYPATLEGLQNIDIRPKIDGFIQRIYVEEGTVVKKGQVLFTINAPQYEQLVRTAEAAINSSEAEVSAAQLQVNKTRPLVEKDIISKYELEAAQLTLQSRKAALAQAKATLANAKVNLGYTTVTAPVEGVVGSLPYKTGSLVSSTSPEPLTTISNISRVYAYFSMNEKQLLDFSRNYEGRTLEAKIKNIPQVQLLLADGQVYPEKGKVESINGLINTQTGSISLKAVFPNPVALLRSGGSATVRIPQHLDNVLLIPQKTTMDLQGKKFVYVADDQGNIKSVNIEIMNVAKGNFYVVTKGLKTGDKIVLEGFQTLKDGAQIKPETVPSDSVYLPLNTKQAI